MSLSSAIVAALTVLAPAGQTVPRSEVLPVERLAPEDRAGAEALILKAMDREGLYTVIGGLKPMSSGFVTLKSPVGRPALSEMARIRRQLTAFRIGDTVTASLQPFWRVYGEDRFLEGLIFHRPTMDRVVEENSQLFGWFGISVGSAPIEAVLAIDRDDTPRRNRAYGYFFGYPRHAVDFFVQSEESRRRGGGFVPRDFLSIPTYELPANGFVYAVPKGYSPQAVDLELKRQALPIFEMYRQLRPRYVGLGKPGIVALIRDWMDDGRGRCSPETARRKAMARASATLE